MTSESRSRRRPSWLGPLARALLGGRSTQIFLFFCILSFAFSQAVVLSTIGLMDGFEYTLKSALNRSTGDLIVTNLKNFFRENAPELGRLKTDPNVAFSTPIIRTEGHLLAQKRSKGVLVQGVTPQALKKIMGLDIALKSGQMIIGKTLSTELALENRQNVTLVLGTGNRQLSQRPLLAPFKIGTVHSFPIYEKDSRQVLVLLSDLQNLMGVPNKVNSLYFLLKAKGHEKHDLIETTAQDWGNKIDYPFVIRTYWSEFSGFLEAVEVEKLSIALILQLIVLIALFNISAFVIFLSERKQQDFFLFRALGLEASIFFKFWAVLLIGIWLISCVVAVVFQELINLALQYLPWFQLPSDIYVVENLQMKLSLSSYSLVFGFSLLWLIIFMLKTFRDLSKKGLLQGLRQGFA